MAPIHFRIYMSVLYQRWNIPNVMNCMFGGVSVIDVLASNSTKTRITICGIDDPKMLPTIFSLTSTERVMLVTLYHYKYYGDFNIDIQFMQSSCEVIYLHPSTSQYMDVSQNVLSTNQVNELLPNDSMINIFFPAESCLVGYIIPSKLYIINPSYEHHLIYALSTYYNDRQYANKIQVYFDTDLCGGEIFVNHYMSQEYKNIIIHIGGKFSMYFDHLIPGFFKWPHCLYIFHAKHIKCHQECNVLKLEIPGLCDICNEQIGNFEFVGDHILSNTTNEIIIWSYANSSVSLSFDGQQCSMNELNVTSFYIQFQYREGFQIRSNWTLKSKSSIHIYSRYNSLLQFIVTTSFNITCSPIFRIQTPISLYEQNEMLYSITMDMLPHIWSSKENGKKPINAKFTYNLFHGKAGVSWNEAEEYCTHSRGHLVSVHSTQELDYILRWVISPSNPTPGIYIGLECKVSNIRPSTSHIHVS